MAEALLPIGFFVIALLYASVGHGGATGYLGLLALTTPTLSAGEASTTALLLNSVVSALALVQFARAGSFPAQMALCFLLGSVPAAFLGSFIRPPLWLFNLLLVIGLSTAALRLILVSSDNCRKTPGNTRRESIKSPPPLLALSVGSLIGLISGIVGIGGGIFLSPLLIFTRWATPRDTAGVAALFVLLNSLAGLLARAIGGTFAIGSLRLPMLTAVIGGLIGSFLGAHRLMPATLNRILAIVLIIACAKLTLELVRP